MTQFLFYLTGPFKLQKLPPQLPSCTVLAWFQWEPHPPTTFCCQGDTKGALHALLLPPLPKEGEAYTRGGHSQPGATWSYVSTVWPVSKCASPHGSFASGLSCLLHPAGPRIHPCLSLGPRAGTVPLFPGLQTSTQFYFYFSSLDKKNIAHQLMQRKSWGEEEGRRTFILALGHLAHLNFHIVSVENAFLSQKPQKDLTCSLLGMLYSRCWFGLCMEVGH